MNKILLVGLYNRAKKDNYTPKEYEDFVNKKFNGYVPPHISNFIDNSDSLEEFLNKIKQWETKKWKTKEL